MHIFYILFLILGHLSCPECGQIFNKNNKKRDLEAHMKRHEVQSQLTCQYCDKTFNFKSKLLVHQKTCKKRKSKNTKKHKKLARKIDAKPSKVIEFGKLVPIEESTKL